MESDAEPARRETESPRAMEDGWPSVSRVAEMASGSSTDFGRTFPDSGLPNNGRVALQVYVMGIIGRLTS